MLSSYYYHIQKFHTPLKVVVVAAAVTEEGPEIFDKVNNCFMKVPREIYLKVKHFYKDDLTFLYDRVNDCPMKVKTREIV